MKVMLADIETDALAAAVKSLHKIGPRCAAYSATSPMPQASIMRPSRPSRRSATSMWSATMPGRRRQRHRQHLARQLAMGARRQFDGRAARHPRLPSAPPRSRRRRPHRQHRVDGRNEQRAGVQSLRGERVRRGGHVGRVAQQLKPLGALGVSVLCPHFVRARIDQSGRNRPQRYGETQNADPASPAGQMLALIPRVSRPGSSGRCRSPSVAAIREDELYVFTHPDMRNAVDARFAAIQAAMERGVIQTLSIFLAGAAIAATIPPKRPDGAPTAPSH